MKQILWQNRLVRSTVLASVIVTKIDSSASVILMMPQAVGIQVIHGQAYSGSVWVEFVEQKKLQEAKLTLTKTCCRV